MKMCYTQVHCPKCGGNDVKNFGYSVHKVSRYFCCNAECETKSFMCRRLKTKAVLLENRTHFLLTFIENKNPAVLTFIENETTIIENKPKTASSAHNH